MSIRLPAQNLVEDLDDGSSASSSDDNAEEETWEDWVSDSAETRACYSLFEDKSLPSAKESIAYDTANHGFNLDQICTKLALDFHQRIRFINYIRKEKPTPADIISATGTEPFFSDDRYLLPVVEDDPLLQIQSDDWSDSDDADAQGPPQDLTTATRRIKFLESSLIKAKQDLTDYRKFVSERLDIPRLAEALSSSPSTAPATPRDDDSHYFQSYGGNEIHAIMLQDKVRTTTYASFILSNQALFRGAVVLDVGCGTGILSLFAARAGAKRVIAVDASDIVTRASKIVEENGHDDVITIISGKVEDITLPDGITQVDIIISEWMGYGLLYESMLDSVLRARDRFLRPGGVMAPSQCQMMICLCDGSDVHKERVAFWSDIYGFDLSAMADEVYEEAIIDVVEPVSLISDPYTIKDLRLGEATPRQLNFQSSFTLVSTAERRTKVHAFLLYFDTFFAPSGNPIPPDTQVEIIREGSPMVAEVWPLGGRYQLTRRASQGGGGSKSSEKERIRSFSTGPRSTPTHWKQTIFLLRDPILVQEGTVVSGTFHCRKSPDNSRELDVEIHYVVKKSVEEPVSGDVVVQMFKVR